MRNRKEKIAISIDPFLLKKIERKARKEGRSRSNYIETIMIKELGEKFTVRGGYDDEPPTKPSRMRAQAY
jgi:metal-responsive CopG/Arc/MetJ family transcriptional regulator